MRGAQVGQQDHVRLVYRLETLDTRPVKTEAVFK